MIWFITLLIPTTALMMGSVHPWAFKAVEESVFAMVMVWIGRIALGNCSSPIVDKKLHVPLIGSLLFLSTVALQLLPLPVWIEKTISPATYRLYQISLPGWPESAPYSWLLNGRIRDGKTIEAPRNLSGRVGKQTEPQSANTASAGADLSPGGGTMFPISVAPSLTAGALLKLLSYFMLGLLIALYPFPTGNLDSSSIYQTLMRVLLATGLLLGLLGLLEEFVSNGKPLWIFTPYSFKGQSIWGMRAFGPFANPDHYACFLAMLLPPALSGMIFPGALGRVRERAAVPILCGVVAVVIIAALLATASRGGMLNAGVGAVVLGWLCSRLPSERRPELFQIKKRKYLILVAGALGMLTLAVFLTGSSNQAVADSRLKESFGGSSIRERLVPAEDSMRMIADFPVFGVGMGAWPDLYRKYARPPWSPIFMNATHDEYIQLLAETGAVGFLLVAAILFAVARRASLKIFDLPCDHFAAIAACIASLAGLATQAALDFPLRIPAIAITATIIFASLIRAVFPDRTVVNRIAKLKPKRLFGTIGAIAGLLALMCLVLRQPQAPYPYDLKTPNNSEGMRYLLLAHPANSRVHLALLGLMDANVATVNAMQELKTTIDLEPNSPIARDIYLSTLARQDQNQLALSQMSDSVFRAPLAADHFYLSPDWIPKLTRAERSAIEKGLLEAVSNRFEGADSTLGDYYERAGQFGKEGDLFIDSARKNRDPKQKAELLNRAGRAFAKAGDYERANTILREAVALIPDDVAAYEYLSVDVDLPRKQFEQARSVLDQGIQAGADRVTLYLTLAEVNRAAKDTSGEEAALQQVVALQPFNFGIIYTLGNLYLAGGQTDEAVLWLRRASEVNPSSADTLFELGQAEELAYQFAAAQNDYTKALALEPGNVVMKSRFQQFKDRVATSSRPD